MFLRGRRRFSFLRPLLIMFMIAFLVQIGLFIFSFITFETWQERAHFGDSFGFISAAFSGFALCGIIYSLAFQLSEQVRQRRNARALIDSDLRLREALINALEAQTGELKAMRETLGKLLLRQHP
ncbi:hypothetical protein [Mesorhizobium sp. L-8-3]|uniref:hypothetical protein n=1 Tax=Mesorhizobium sp. L-8-3 TaxID=2744522 RepID=UPI001927C36D|nr:hypothetical protein [Mesorhizobium sp. L-8-3]BCH24560.1 hypothetical protein MesoLjLb_43450 [Mesorhizobium sp. L-8-3]